jgi:CubicO group peptidase (beta-lactamase class C family)
MDYILLWLIIILLLTIIIKKNLNRFRQKYIEYKNNQIITYNNIDNDILNEYSQFLIGSITKIFIIFIILLLHQNKLLDINNTLHLYFKSNDNFSNITILDLINHVSGIKTMPNLFFKIKNYISFIIPESYFKNKYLNIQNISSIFENENIFTLKKGEYSYSNIGYILLGVIIEKTTKLTYLATLEKYIIKPLNLNNTYFGKTNIKLYNNYFEPVHSDELFLRYTASTAGGLYSTIHDLIIFSRESIKLFNDETINLLKKTCIYSYDNEYHIIQHNGIISGGRSILKIFYNNDWKLKDIYIKLSTIHE